MTTATTRTVAYLRVSTEKQADHGVSLDAQRANHHHPQRDGGFGGHALVGQRIGNRRQWPDGVLVRVTEQVPAALWGEDGLLNSRGELFVQGVDWPSEVLPRLSGPEGAELRVAARLQQLRQLLAPRGLEITAVNLDARGSWQIKLASGLEVRFGRRSVEKRIQRFVDALDLILAEDLTRMAYIDMRYSHGFAVGRGRDAKHVSKLNDFRAEPNV